MSTGTACDNDLPPSGERIRVLLLFFYIYIFLFLLPRWHYYTTLYIYMLLLYPDEGDKRDTVSRARAVVRVWCGLLRPQQLIVSVRSTAIVADVKERKFAWTVMDPTPPPTGGGGFLSNRRIKLTAVFPMIGGTRRTVQSKSDSSSLAKTGKSTVAVATATPVERPVPPPAPRNRMRRGSSLTDLNRADSLAGT